jgi:UDP-2,3-diacylglucosamine hydrolase
MNMNEKTERKVAKRSRTYFISDLHLDESRLHLTKLFFDFIDDIQNKAEALYILGDLFEFWIGDDIIDLPIGKYYLPIIEKLKSLSDSGTKLYFMQGNRDFLAQQGFTKRIGAELLPDQLVIDLYGTPALIMHGDTLCTDDKGYQRMRAIFRLKIVQKLYLSLSPESRAKKANNIRQSSKSKTQKKTQTILDVNQDEVTKQLKRGGVGLLIHGHTHRPAEHVFELDGKQAKRIVLSDWHDKACYLCVTPNNFESIF